MLLLKLLLLKLLLLKLLLVKLLLVKLLLLKLILRCFGLQVNSLSLKADKDLFLLSFQILSLRFR
jgi:hypothetical protein